MSGLWSGRRVWSSFLPPLLVPRIGEFGRDRTVGAGLWFGHHHRFRPCRDRLKIERPSLGREAQRPIHAFFHLRGVGRDQLHLQLTQRPVKLTLRLRSSQLLFHYRLGGRAVRRMLVGIERVVYQRRGHLYFGDTAPYHVGMTGTIWTRFEVE